MKDFELLVDGERVVVRAGPESCEIGGRTVSADIADLGRGNHVLDHAPAVNVHALPHLFECHGKRTVAAIGDPTNLRALAEAQPCGVIRCR